MATAGVPKTVKDMLAEGSITKVYGSQYLLNIQPAFNIDRVRFSIVKLGSAGKEHSDIYLTTEEVRQFVEEIENGKAEYKIMNDASKYPQTFQWVKGENGSKRLSIGPGQKGILVQISINENGAWSHKMTVVQMSDFKQLAFLFKLTAGLIPVVTESYYGELFSTYWENIRKA